MGNKLSFSAISKYTECGKKYQLHYKQRLRGKYFHSALAYGSAVDEGLNELLKNKDLDKSLQSFDKKWNFQYINNKLTALPKATNVVYAEADTDLELLLPEDIQKLDNEYGNLWEQMYDNICEQKKSVGWNNLPEESKELYNYLGWLSLRRKGHIMINSYREQILPRINRVITVQHQTSLVNADGDEIVQYLDLIVEWEDGSLVLMDNKTSAKDYDPEAALTSPQLISYYVKAKNEFGVNAVGFLVMKKQIMKNKKKICKKCNHDGSESRAKTCDKEYPGKVLKRSKEVDGMIRCDGEWSITLDPKCFIQVIISPVNDFAEQTVMSTFSEANEGIKKEVYHRNLKACGAGTAYKCDYFNLCWTGKDEDLIQLEEK